ncbi:DUF1722 domain-containing protein, partial [Staphylococcus aureus]|nr:DUF1722 domain-containing protein [Staphylococcus aureus]
DFNQGIIQSTDLLIFLKHLADKYHVSYLQNSTLLNIEA